MVQRIVRNEHDLKMLGAFLAGRKRPFTVDIASGKHRSIEQNKLQRLWLNEAAAQLGDQTAEELRGLCKLTIGVPILRAENEDFREKYDAIVRPLPYAAKLAIMMEPLDMPVTRLMKAEQKTRYLDGIHRMFAEQGVVLTDPEGAYA